MDNPFVDAIIQAATTRSNLGASPAQTAENAGQIANLQNLGGLKFIAAAAGLAGKAGAGNAANNAENAEAARRAAEQEKMINLEQAQRMEQRKREQESPENYQRILNDAGGYTFVDGTGKPISVNEYARGKNQTIADALKDSADPNDIDFTNDYQDTMKLGSIMASGNKKELDKFYEERPGLKSFISDNGIKTWSEYVQRFRSAYPDRFSQAQANATATRNVSPNINIGG